ncbi:hypothetical protein BH11MYX4_BH11MYX4_42480 [soil metagenome]
MADGFWNIRGSFMIAGFYDLGTQASLVRRASGKFVVLDSCSIADDTRRWIHAQTRDGDDIEAILNLHPFHTLHVRSLHEAYPRAKLYGTARHRAKLADLPWQPLLTEDPALHEAFREDLGFSVPRGVDFIPKNENLHFSSVLAFHHASKTLHVDDTLLYMRVPWPFRLFKPDVTRLHPTLGAVLERRAGAAADFRAWARELVERTRDVQNLCAAHSTALLAGKNEGASIAARVEAAVRAVEGKLQAHERKFG